jgi:hypothetical protein
VERRDKAVKPLSIRLGSAVLLGAPAKPMPQAQSQVIGEMIRSVAGVREAYLPQCFVREVMEAPAQVLVLVIDKAANLQSVLDAVSEGLTRVLPPGTHLDVWPMRVGDNLLSTVRGTRTHIHCPPPPKKKPWWKKFG